MEHYMWYTIQTYNMLKEQFGDGRSTQLVLPCPAWKKSTQFTELIHANQKCIKPIYVRQPSDEVHGPILKLVTWYRQRL